MIFLGLAFKVLCVLAGLIATYIGYKCDWSMTSALIIGLLLAVIIVVLQGIESWIYWSD